MIRSTRAASPRASPLHPAAYRARGRSCFEIRRFKGETSLKLVALVRGEAATESLVKRYNDSPDGRGEECRHLLLGRQTTRRTPVGAASRCCRQSAQPTESKVGAEGGLALDRIFRSVPILTIPRDCDPLETRNPHESRVEPPYLPPRTLNAPGTSATRVAVARTMRGRRTID